MADLRRNGLPSTGEDYADPLHPDPAKRFTPLTSSTANGYLSFDASVNGPEVVNNLDHIRARSKTVMLFEKASNPAVLSSLALQLAELRNSHFDHTHSPRWFRWYPRRIDRVLRDITAEIDLARHGQAAHFAYADSHVAIVAESQGMVWIETGFDFTKPAE